MKRFIKIFIITFCFIGGVGFAQTVTPGYTGITAPCTQTLCQPFNQTDLRQIWQAIMFTSSNQTVTNTGTLSLGQLCSKKNYTVSNTASTYTAGNVLGTQIGINNLSRVYPLPVEIQDISIIDLNGQTPSMIIDFYQFPFTTQVNNTPLNLTGEQDKLIGSVLILASDWVVSGGVSRLSLTNVGIVLDGIEWNFTLTTLSGVTYSTSNSIGVKLGVKRN